MPYIMSLKNNLLLFLFLATLSHEIFGQRGGFLDKKNQLDVDLFEMTQQNRFSLGYKFSYREHLGFTARVSYQGLRNWELEDYITVGVDQNGSEINKYVTYGSYSVKSFEAGAGLLFNSKNTGFALPLGNYMSIMYLIHSSSHSETVDSLNLTSNYKNN